jgi:hypothetical protein
MMGVWSTEHAVHDFVARCTFAAGPVRKLANVVGVAPGLAGRALRDACLTLASSTSRASVDGSNPRRRDRDQSGTRHVDGHVFRVVQAGVIFHQPGGTPAAYGVAQALVWRRGFQVGPRPGLTCSVKD